MALELFYLGCAALGVGIGLKVKMVKAALNAAG